MSCARKPGDRIRLFNGRDGEWESVDRDPRCSAAPPFGRSPGFPRSLRHPDLRLLFAPLKSERTRFVVEKATELGVGAIHPVLTRYGQTRRVNVERLRAHAIEAAEQCGRLEVPSPSRPPALSPTRSRTGRQSAGCWSATPRPRRTIAEAAAGDSGASWAILIGPEGGFAPDERRLLDDHPAAVHARLGPRILRAETAVAAALACWQALAGDWQ